ncbi:hypothetical protein HDG32_006920 [Paraburkholderia sp. CI2]|nr:hypothetical protein [Paraburkholderia sp. CI2]
MPTTVRLPDVQVPGTEQLSRFGSKYADEPGSDNLTGVKSPAVDAILRKVLGAQTREQLVDATHALDRVLMNGHYVTPALVFRGSLHRVSEQPRLSSEAAALLRRRRMATVDVVAEDGWTESCASSMIGGKRS